MPLLKLILLVLLIEKGNSVCRLQGSGQPAELAKDGDLFIGGIFSFRTGQDYVINTFQKIPEVRKCKKYVLLGQCILNGPCSIFLLYLKEKYKDLFCHPIFHHPSFNFREFKFAQAMIFAINEINKNPHLLPHFKLGYKIYDNCGTMDILRAALSLVSGLEGEVTDGNCSKTETVQAILGHSGSRPTIAFAQVVGRFQIPVVSKRSEVIEV